MANAQAQVVGGGRPARWKRWSPRLREPRPPVLVSLSAGGVRGDETVKNAHHVVAVHAPVDAARLRELYIKSQYLLLPSAAESCRRYIEDDIIAAAEILDPSPSGSTAEAAVTLATAVLSERVQRAEQGIAEQSETRALRQYARGLTRAMIYALLILFLITLSTKILLVLIYHGQPPSDVNLALYHTVVTIGGGAAGAALSVLLRKTDPIGDVDDVSLARAAVIRVILGCIFAAALIFLVRGDIFTAIRVPAVEGSGVQTWFFWGGMGFLAGFNERWVQHIITRTPDSETKKQFKPEKDTPPD